MKNFILLSLTAIFTTIPSGAKPFPVVNPTEPMLIVPGLEFLGASRVSTVQHCMALTGTTELAQMITDSDFESMHACLVEHT